MLDIHDDFSRFMGRICQMTRRDRHEAILAEIREQANAARIERAGDDVLVTLHGITGQNRTEAAAIGDWYRKAKDRRKAEGRAA